MLCCVLFHGGALWCNGMVHCVMLSCVVLRVVLCCVAYCVVLFFGLPLAVASRVLHGVSGCVACVASLCVVLRLM